MLFHQKKVSEIMKKKKITERREIGKNIIFTKRELKIIEPPKLNSRELVICKSFSR